MAVARRLTALKVNSLMIPGRYGDGEGLYLYVKPAAGGGVSKSWVLRYSIDGRRRDMGLGRPPVVTLAEARELAMAARKQLATAIDPLVVRARSREKRRRLAGHPTFETAARSWHEEAKDGWRSEKQRKAALTMLETYAFPEIGTVRIDEVEAGDIRRILAPLWIKKPETGRRLRQRLMKVVEWAAAEGYRSTPLSLALVNTSLPKQPRAEHRKAMPWQDVPAFIKQLRAAENADNVRAALELLVLTAARSSEVRGASWEEFDLVAGLWSVPAERMKAGRPHLVPLPPAALELLKVQLDRRVECSGLVFPGRNLKSPLSDMTLSMFMRRENLEAVPHGFRSSFRDWAADNGHAADLAEAALAHAPGDKTIQAYQRSDMLDRRRQLMVDWASFCTGAAK